MNAANFAILLFMVFILLVVVFSFGFSFGVKVASARARNVRDSVTKVNGKPAQEPPAQPIATTLPPGQSLPKTTIAAARQAHYSRLATEKATATATAKKK